MKPLIWFLIPSYFCDRICTIDCWQHCRGQWVVSRRLPHFMTVSRLLPYIYTKVPSS